MSTILDINNAEEIHLIKDICNTYLGKDYDAYQQGGCPINDYYRAWFPKMSYKMEDDWKSATQSKEWINYFEEGEEVIVEYNKNEERNPDDSRLNYLRITFAKKANEEYKFIGVYKTEVFYNPEYPYQYRKYRRIATQLDLSKLSKIDFEKEEIAAVEEASKIKELSETEKTALMKQRIGQGQFRGNLLKKYKSKCALCGLGYKELLIASHIKGWAAANDNERMDKENGLLLCAQHDALFDKHLISFDDNGKILISKSIKEKDRVLLNINLEQKIKMSKQMKDYMSFHREKFEEFQNSNLKKAK